jgi:hypothetical protein
VKLLRIGAWITGAIALLSLALLAVGLFLPSTWEAETEAVLAAPPEAVYARVDGAEGWLAWTPAPDEGVTRFGPARGAGSGYAWDDPAWGSGRFAISAATPPRVVAYEVEVEGGIRIEGRLELEAVDEGTRVRWSEAGDFGWNPMLGYLSGRMASLQGEQLRQSLEELRALVEEGEGPADPGSVSPAPPG